MSARILVVDDDAHVLRTLVSSMTRSGHAACSAADVEGAVCLLTSETFDVLLCDYHLGMESGLDVIRACRGTRRGTFIMMLTGEDDEETRNLAFAAGADLVLAKPVSTAELRSHVSRAVTQAA